MTGKQLRKIRKESKLTAKQFYEERLGFTFYTAGLSLEKFAEIPDTQLEKLEKAGFFKRK